MRIEQRDTVALLRLEAGKANAMSHDLLAGINQLLDELEQGEARAVVITGYEKYFSAGLALPTLIDCDRPQMKRFMSIFSDTMLRVFRLPLPVVAAINGHAVAGGCVLALQADYRLMADGRAKIGLSEAQLGIGLPTIVIEALRCALPASSLLPVALQGQLLAAPQARQLGLVDEVVAAEELEAQALAKAKTLAGAPGVGFAQIKAALRRPHIAALEDDEAQLEIWLDSWFSPAAQEKLQAAVAGLSQQK